MGEKHLALKIQQPRCILKGKRPHFRWTYVAQKHLCSSSVTTPRLCPLVLNNHVTRRPCWWTKQYTFFAESAFLRPIHTRDFAPGACSRVTLREESSSVCTNDFMGILHPREQNFHPAKCSTIFNRLNIWEQAPGAN